MTEVVRICHYPRRDGPLPEGAKWVGRPSRWGNPYKPDMFASAPFDIQASMAVALYRRYLLPELKLELEPLLGATALACACPIGDPCHADLLVEAVNKVHEDTMDTAVKNLAVASRVSESEARRLIVSVLTAFAEPDKIEDHRPGFAVEDHLGYLRQIGMIR